MINILEQISSYPNGSFQIALRTSAYCLFYFECSIFNNHILIFSSFRKCLDKTETKLFSLLNPNWIKLVKVEIFFDERFLFREKSHSILNSLFENKYFLKLNLGEQKMNGLLIMKYKFVFTKCLFSRDWRNLPFNQWRTCFLQKICIHFDGILNSTILTS